MNPPKKISRLVFFAGLLYLCLSPLLWAQGNIEISKEAVSEGKPGRYKLTFEVENKSADPREIKLRAQIEIFDQTAPRGDLPVSLLRKDETLVLQAGEKRAREILFLSEGTRPKGALRIEPVVRVRRDRVWNY